MKTGPDRERNSPAGLRVLGFRALRAQRRAELIGMLRMARHCPSHSGAWVELAEFLREHDELHDDEPGRQLQRALPQARQWHELDPYERLRGAAKDATRWAIDYSRNLSPAAEAPYDDPIPELTFRNRNFVFTGVFALHPRASCENVTRRLGGRVQAHIRLNTSFLVVGEIAHPAWLHGARGTKVDKAVQLRRERRSAVRIIHERTFVRRAAKHIRELDSK